MSVQYDEVMHARSSRKKTDTRKQPFQRFELLSPLLGNLREAGGGAISSYTWPIDNSLTACMYKDEQPKTNINTTAAARKEEARKTQQLRSILLAQSSTLHHQQIPGSHASTLSLGVRAGGNTLAPQNLKTTSTQQAASWDRRCRSLGRAASAAPASRIARPSPHLLAPLLAVSGPWNPATHRGSPELPIARCPAAAPLLQEALSPRQQPSFVLPQTGLGLTGATWRTALPLP